MKKILITGATSLLATNTIIELLKRGYKVKGLLRDKAAFQVDHPDIELVCGDVSSIEDLDKSIEGCDGVIHIAAVTSQSLTRYSDYEHINVQGTKNVLQSALRHPISKFVYVSSANAFGYGSESQPGHELLPIHEPFSNSYYALSKCEGQKHVLETSKLNNSTSIMVVNPTFMLGAYDAKPSSGKIIIAGYKKKVVFYPPGGKNFIHVKDAAKGVVNALEKGLNGEAYILSNVNMTYEEFFRILARRTKSHTIFIPIPRFLLLAIGIAGDCLRFFNIRTAISSSNMKILCIKNYYGNLKARLKLDLPASPIEKAIDDAIKWFSKTNRLKTN